MRTPGARTAILAVALLCLLPPYASAQQDADREISAVYAAEAISLYRDNDYSAAREIARRGLDFAADNSDLHALIGMALSHSVDRTRQALDAFARAFRHNRFTHLAATEVAGRYGELLNRVGRHENTLSLIESLSLNTMLYPDLLYLESRALFALERVQAAERRASVGIRIYLDDPRFYRLLLERHPAPGYRDYLAVKRYERDSADYRRLLLSYAERIPATPHRRQVVEDYFALGGDDPSASLLLLEDGEKQADELERFRQLGGAREQDLLLQAYNLVTERLKQLLVEQMTDFDGELVVDSDRNGIAEQTMYFERGELLRWRIDSAQDGVIEYDIEFQDGTPRRVEHDGPAGFKELQYTNYPEVRKIRFGNETTMVYFPIADRLEILLLDPDLRHAQMVSAEQQRPPALRPPALHPHGLIVDRAAVERNSAYVEFYRDGMQRPYRVTELVDGVAVRSVEDRSGDGAVDHILTYRDGQPQEGMRDLFGTGRFEVLEQYRRGELQRLTVTTEPGQAAEFYQEFGEVEVLSWDFDRDGSPDVRERYFEDELILREYADGGDGVFDLPMSLLSDILGSRDE